ncbi:MAG TPA: 4Fe-4S binding protein, partial [Candidatus Scatomorpha stercorigallinarum]|nr:4Fe-4S binding protein [Candidatus Scatomorpha stercorigallinarum]
ALRFTEEVNAKGYRMVAVDESKCIYCGICYTVCPDYVFTIEEGSDNA